MRSKGIILIIAAAVIIAAAAIWIIESASKPNIQSPSAPAQQPKDKLETITNSEEGVTIDVTPAYSAGKPIAFDIVLTTHQGSMDFDMTQNTVLIDSNGNVYNPTAWDGSPPGGHHRSGTLTFPQLKGDASSMKIIVKDVNGVPERIFSWQLK